MRTVFSSLNPFQDCFCQFTSFFFPRSFDSSTKYFAADISPLSLKRLKKNIDLNFLGNSIFLWNRLTFVVGLKQLIRTIQDDKNTHSRTLEKHFAKLRLTIWISLNRILCLLFHTFIFNMICFNLFWFQQHFFGLDDDGVNYYFTKRIYFLIFVFVAALAEFPLSISRVSPALKPRRLQPSTTTESKKNDFPQRRVQIDAHFNSALATQIKTYRLINIWRPSSDQK